MRRSLALLLLGACGGRGALEIEWTIGGEPPNAEVAVCSRRGLDAIKLSILATESQETLRDETFACRFGRGRVGALDPEEVDLRILGLSPGSATLVEVAIERVQIVEDDTASVAVDLPPPPSCADSVDNDADGRVDGRDLDCSSSGEEPESADPSP